MKHPYFHAGAKPVFDSSRAGTRIIAERQDEPGGPELEGFGAFDPMADLMGDWSWKPHRYAQDPGSATDAEAVNARLRKRGHLALVKTLKRETA